VASLIIGMDGSVHSMGSSKRGQLGLGPGRPAITAPQRLPGIEGVVSVSCGWGHALALTGAHRIMAIMQLWSRLKMCWKCFCCAVGTNFFMTDGCSMMPMLWMYPPSPCA
jgi:hypothetical protein